MVVEVDVAAVLMTIMVAIDIIMLMMRKPSEPPSQHLAA